MEGMGDLGRNLEFMMMKIAQLETVVELQQLQIKDMNEWRKAHMSQEHNDPQQPPSTQEVQLAAKTKIRQAHDTLKGAAGDAHLRNQSPRDAATAKAAAATAGSADKLHRGTDGPINVE
ncbi:unnamed protein product [Symbiodinium necroappetens]|uniref:Uncharacterized protein n=1 Tax=Symbiodinium necroappetens TaxID=1628268 RepID=A0A812SZQ9_9DINO|nr:unnamed protein product [Symbiodinium necroappetens]